MKRVSRAVAWRNFYISDSKDIEFLDSLEDRWHLIYDVDQSI